MADCLIALGANLGGRAGLLEKACDLIDQHALIRIEQRSRFVETAPVGGPSGQSAFLNAAASITTNLQPLELLSFFQSIETRLGKSSSARWAARPIDLDLLLYDDAMIDLPELIIPHPRMSFRRFVLAPAAEIAADRLEPFTGLTIAQLLERLDRLPNYMALEGASREDCANIAHQVAARGDVIKVVSDPSSVLSTDLVPQQVVLADHWLPSVKPTEPEPKLLALLACSAAETTLSDRQLAWLCASDDGSPRQVAASEYLRALRNEARVRQIPVLFLDADDLEWATRDVSAAILAMQ